MRISKEDLRRNMTTALSAAFLEDYIDDYLRKEHGKEEWVRLSFTLGAALDDYNRSIKKKSAVQTMVVRALNKTRNMKAIDGYIEQAIAVAEGAGL